MKFQFVKGETSVILIVFIQNSSSTTGAGLGSLDQSSSITGGYVKRDGTGVALAVDENVTTEGTYQAPSTAAQVRIGTPANMPTGFYEFHFHNDLFTTADYVTMGFSGATNMAPLTLEIQLTDVDLNDGVRAALTALPNAAADAAGGLPISDAGGLDLDTILGRITANVALASVCTEVRLAELGSANIPADIDILLTRIIGTLAAGTHNAQSGDSYARLGAPAGASVSADIAVIDGIVDAILVDTAEIGAAGAGLTDLGGMSTGMQAEVQSECNDALVALALDHLFAAAITGTDVTDDSFAALIVSNSATADFDDYDNTSDSLPALAASIGNITVGSAAISTVADSFTGTTVSVASGSVTDTETLNGVYHQLQDVAGTLEVYYEFDVTGSGVATEATFTGRINGGNDTLDGVYAYNWGGASWDRVGDLNGKAGSTDDTLNYSLLTRHTGTGANLGLVRIRFYAASGLTSANLYVDQIFASYSVVAQSVGYSDGAIWVDTNASNTNTEVFVDGVADNPVSTWAAALTLSASLGIARFRIINGSSITLTGNSDNYTLIGNNWTLALGGQSCAGAYFSGATVSGICTGDNVKFFDGNAGILTTDAAIFQGTVFTSVTGYTLGTAGKTVDFLDCKSGIAGAGSPVFNWPGAGASFMNFRNYSGGVQFENMVAADTSTIEGRGQFIEGTCTGGDVTLRSVKTTSGITNITVNEDSNLGFENGSVWFDSSNGEAGTALGVGSISRPSSVIADHRTIADANNLRNTTCIAGSLITLDQSYQNWNWLGTSGLITFNSQDCSGSTYFQMGITGICTGAVRQVVNNCGVIGPCTMPITNFLFSGFINTFTFGDRGDYLFERCNSALTSTSSFDLAGDGATPTTAIFAGWEGELEFQNITSTDVIVITGRGKITINANCTGGNIRYYGDFIIVDNASGAVTTTEDTNTANLVSILADTNELQGDWADGGRLDVILDARSSQSSVDTIDGIVDAILVDTADMQPKLGTPAADISADIAALNDLSEADIRTAFGAVTGTAITGTLSTTQCTTDLTETTNDHYIGRLLTFTGGNLSGQQTDITDYDGTTKLLTFTAMTEAPSNTDPFIIT